MTGGCVEAMTEQPMSAAEEESVRTLGRVLTAVPRNVEQDMARSGERRSASTPR